MRPPRLARLRTVVLVGALIATLPNAPTSATVASTSTFTTPIRHIVVIYQENHSFNNVLGQFCRSTGRCPFTATGSTATGQTIPLRVAPDLVPPVGHDHGTQLTAIDGGAMDGFSRTIGCRSSEHRCYQWYGPRKIPNLWGLARHFAISDATFEMNPVPSWGSHLGLATTTLDGFTGNNPVPSKTGATSGPGWGCDSHLDTTWRSDPSAPMRWVPSCVPNKGGGGPYRHSPVPWVPTIMDRLRAAGVSWRIFAPPVGSGRIPHGWAICSTFADCLYTREHTHVFASDRVVGAAKAGRLPHLTLVLPAWKNSQHNGTSMRQGDNWIGSVVGAIMHGPQWLHTAIFITYDDCGCFYDQVPPPASGLGIRVPMVIVSPYARPHYTDTSTATFASLLAYAEHVLGLRPLSTVDSNAYDFHNAFNYRQAPLGPTSLTSHPVPPWERHWIRGHAPEFANDPT
jgi:phospholipase C